MSTAAFKTPDLSEYPDFDLVKLINTVFSPTKKEKVAILIDLEDPKDIENFSFLSDPKYSVQKNAVEYFHKPLNESLLDEMGMEGGEIFAYKITGASNLDLPDEAFDPSGKQLSLSKDVYPNYSLILCISTYSATAPLTAFAKEFGFRGATLHGLNDIIIRSGLCVDYNEVSKEAEKIRLGLTKAETVEIDFEVDGTESTLRLILEGQEAQKSHGLCHGGPDVANLPAGEVYFVPESAEGSFPLQFDDGTIAMMEVKEGYIKEAAVIKGEQSTVDEFIATVKSDPSAGQIGELGFGTQLLPVSGVDIQDEKIRGTVHVATGRSDHLGGDITPDKFHDQQNASHEDILFAPEKTPDINVPQVRVYWEDRQEVVIENYTPSAYINGLLS